MLVGLLGLGPLRAEAELLGLEHHVGELAAGDLVLVHLRVGPDRWPRMASRRGAAGPSSCPGPARGGRLGPGRGPVPSSEARMRDAGLGRHAGHAVRGRVDRVGPGHSARHHGGDAGAGRVVGVHVDGELGYFSRMAPMRSLAA